MSGKCLISQWRAKAMQTWWVLYAILDVVWLKIGAILNEW